MSRSTPRKRQDAGETDVSAPIPEQLRRGVTWLILLLALGSIGYLFLRNASAWSATAAEVTPASPTVEARVEPTAAPASARKPRVGIVSGHRGNDSGAVCKEDGLTEADVNYDHATRVSMLLLAAGYEVDILDEKDERLKGYVADVYLSIHADSCVYINELATGYKVARSVHSAVPEAEDRLVACLTKRYATRTGMKFHRNTITANMREYHGFYKIDANTPSAIIETGFLALDRDMLTKRADDVAGGIADGLVCFLRDEQP
jgi:N-acetylmuramoyl-L-alanine amidase